MKRVKENQGQRRWEETTSLGSSIVFAILVVAFYFTGNSLEALFLVLGWGLINLVTLVVRFFYFKDRPEKRAFSNLLEKLDASSFPSIHAQRALFLAPALSIHFANAYLSGLFFALAYLVCYSRIRLLKHHGSDVVVGAIVGVLEFYALDYAFALMF